MKKTVITILSIVGIVVGIICVPYLFLGFLVVDKVNDVKDAYGYSNEEIRQYVDEKYGIPVQVVQNEGRDSSKKGLVVEDALVRTEDEDQLEFQIHINPFGRITGDSYENVKQRYDLNHAYNNSEIFNKLREIGFIKITFGEHADDPALSMHLPENRGIADLDTLQMIYDSVPVWKQLQEEVEKDEYVMNEVSINGAMLNINDSYDSPEDLGNQLAANNISHFIYPFIEEDKEKVHTILPNLHGYGFNKGRDNIPLECDQMLVYTECNAYSLTLYTYEDAMRNSDFRYDRATDKKNLFMAIKDMKTLDLPIEKVYVDHIYTPDNMEDQYYSEKELEEREKRVYFGKRKVSILNLNNIEAVEDIHFVY